ncbi:MAG: hypothetical protein JNG86_10130, partial [Verrucomicrobiaceae bacterium]|nr:hypothetical protein [Verrucomicrobiaceae bacterium]
MLFALPETLTVGADTARVSAALDFLPGVTLTEYGVIHTQLDHSVTLAVTASIPVIPFSYPMDLSGLLQGESASYVAYAKTSNGRTHYSASRSFRTAPNVMNFALSPATVSGGLSNMPAGPTGPTPWSNALQMGPPQPGTDLGVIANSDSGFAYSTPHSSLPNGQKMDLPSNNRSFPYFAWYFGGDGNDLVLRPQALRMAGWGIDSQGQISALPSPHPVSEIASLVSANDELGSKTVVQVVRGASHTLALCADGTVFAWGSNGSGQLGDPANSGTYRSSVLKAARTPLTQVIAISAGATHNLALTADNKLWAWGSNASGQLGDGTQTGRSYATLVSTGATSAMNGKTVVSFAAGENHSVALCSDGTVVTWGGNSAGQLGLGDGPPRATIGSSTLPVAVRTTAGSALASRRVTAVAAGSNFSLALCSDGTVAGWGANSMGQLGIP